MRGTLELGERPAQAVFDGAIGLALATGVPLRLRAVEDDGRGNGTRSASAMTPRRRIARTTCCAASCAAS